MSNIYKKKPVVLQPLKLKTILHRHKLTQVSLARAVKYTDGRSLGNTLSPTVANELCRNVFPVGMPKADVVQQVESFLRENGVTEFEIKTAWDIEPQAEPIRVKSRNAPNDSNHTSAGADPVSQDQLTLPEKEMLAESTRQHFKLFKHPFIDDVQGPDDVYLSAEQRYIRESMYQAAKLGGLIAIVGESGSGKTTLRRDLLDRIRRSAEPIRVIQPQVFDKTRLTAGHICDAIISDLTDSTNPQSLEQKARLVKQLLSESSQAGNSHVLIIEEAHDLHISTLKYLKRFWELEDGFKKLLAIILVGQSELGIRLDERRNPQAREIIRRCEVAVLKPLNGNLEEYLALKFKRVGADLKQIFEPDAFDAIRDRLTYRMRGNNEVQSQMYPLIVHNVCIKAMNQAAELSEPRVTADLIKAV